jgi:sec-independent protein translocase protein TatC
MEDNGNALPVTAHLRELRKRLIICLIAAAAGFFTAYAFSEKIYSLLASPLLSAMPDGENSMAFITVTEPFIVYLKVGLAGGVIIASPVILYQIWAFAAPGLYRGEKTAFLASVAASLVLFASGAAFAYFIVFPFAFKYLLGYANENLKPVISMGAYFSLALKLLIAFGVVFQLPLGMLVASRLGVADAKKFLLWWRYAIVAIFTAAAILTPTPDVFNQLLMAGPLIALYGAGVIVSAIFGKKKTGQVSS